MFYRTDLTTLYYFNGASWIAIAGSALNELGQDSDVNQTYGASFGAVLAGKLEQTLCYQPPASFVSTSLNTGTATLANPPIAGHTMLLWVNGSDVATITPPSGWTLYVNTYYGGHYYMWYKTSAGASDQSATVTLTTSTSAGIGILLVETNSTGTPTGLVNNASAPSISSVPAGAQIWCIFGGSGGTSNLANWVSNVNNLGSAGKVDIQFFTPLATGTYSPTSGIMTNANSIFYLPATSTNMFAFEGAVYIQAAFPSGTIAPGTLCFRTDLVEMFMFNNAGAWEVSTTCGYGSTDPTSPTPVQGQMFYNTTSTNLVIYNGSSWVNALSSVAATVSIGTSFPGSPTTGTLFFRSDLFQMFLYTGSVWEVTGATGTGTTFPTSPTPIEGQEFYRTDLLQTYIYHSSSWILASSDYTTTSSNFTIPAVSSTGTMAVVNSNIFQVGQYIQVVQTAPFIGLITAIASLTSMTVETIVAGTAGVAGTITSGAVVALGGGPASSGGGTNPYTTTTSNYTVPAVNSSGTIAVASAAIFQADQYIQVNGGTTPFVGLITSISGLNLTVTTLAVGSASTISSGAYVTYSGAPGTGGGGGGGGTTTLSAAYVQPAVGLSGTMTPASVSFGVAPFIIQIETGGVTPFIGKVTSVGGSTWAVTTLQVGDQQPLASGATVAFSGPPGNINQGMSFDQVVLSIPGLSNYYPMNESSGTVVYDVKGGSNGTYVTATGMVYNSRSIPANDGEPVPNF
jgi:hypothetical protein